MNISREDKIKIVARNFYDEDPEGFESYEQAVKEIGEQTHEPFMDTMIKWMQIPADGYRSMMKDGYVINVNNFTGHVLPVSEMTDEQGAEIQKQFVEASDKFPETTTCVVIMQDMGWKLL